MSAADDLLEASRRVGAGEWDGPWRLYRSEGVWRRSRRFGSVVATVERFIRDVPGVVYGAGTQDEPCDECPFIPSRHCCVQRPPSFVKGDTP